MIYQYNNKVFTYEGQCTVSAFFYEMMSWKDKMTAINGLVVYAGYHGDENGEFHHEFDADEIDTIRTIVSAFPNAKIHWVTSQGLSDEEIKFAYKKGSVFFIWCDSNNKIKSTLGSVDLSWLNFVRLTYLKVKRFKRGESPLA